MLAKGAILLVDDSDVIAGVLAQFFGELGYQILRAHNGAEAVEMVYKEIPDVIILDIEMPLLKGYQASRLLKSRREVSKIPIIMHTTLDKDKDQYWGRSSGADAYVTKNFDNLEELKDKVELLIGSNKIEKDIVRSDAAKITREFVFEMLGERFDNELFQATILNQLGSLIQEEDLEQTVVQVFEIFKKVSDYQVAVLIVQRDNHPYAYIYPRGGIGSEGIEDFEQICLGDYQEKMPRVSLEGFSKKVFTADNENISSNNENIINSYACFELFGKGGAVVGTFHVGSSINNYFSEQVCSNILTFVGGASVILENVLLFEKMSGMNKKIRHIFSKFVPPEVIDDLLQHEQTASMMHGEKRDVVVLFSDIRSFTKISENNSAEQVVNFLNNYFEKMVEIITSHGGTIDKFIGDAILAVFGAPRSYEDNEMRAVNAALGMINALSSIDSSNLVLPPAGFNIGVGIHRGPAIVGNIGSKDKFDYTVIGDTVNLASRLEGMTKHYRQHIIVSNAVVESLDQSVVVREVDMVKVKGKVEATSLFTVYERLRPALSEEVMADYKKALSMYKIKNWNIAVEYFKKVLEQKEDDYLASLYIKRCEKFEKDPPPAGWDGAIAFDHK